MKTRVIHNTSHFLDPRQRARGTIISIPSCARHKAHAPGEFFSDARGIELDPLQIQAPACCRTSIHLPEYRIPHPLICIKVFNSAHAPRKAPATARHDLFCPEAGAAISNRRRDLRQALCWTPNAAAIFDSSREAAATYGASA